MHHLLRAPNSRARKELALAQSAIAAAFPLKTAHRKDLPLSIQELSLLLTAERAKIHGYWQKPSLTGAYLYYFLPWNLLRLLWLLPGLPLDLPENSRVLDLGSGPLTLPLGLWLACPALRQRRLSITCADTAQQPLELGRSVFERLQQEETGALKPGWELRLLRAPLDVALRKSGKVSLITAGNVLNEISAQPDRLEERLEEIFHSMNRILEPGGQILLLEPGTRLGGKLIALMRRLALKAGYSAEAPCTHQEECPYAPPENFYDDEAPSPGKFRDKNTRRQVGGWCHFTLTPDGAPPELQELSRNSHLEKDRLSLACLLLRKADGHFQSTAPDQDKIVRGGLLTPVRVISDLIKLPESGESARYVCSRHGLGLLQQAGFYKSGMLLEAMLPDQATRDAKSGAWNMQSWQPAGTERTQKHKVQSNEKTRPGRKAQPEQKAQPGKSTQPSQKMPAREQARPNQKTQPGKKTRSNQKAQPGEQTRPNQKTRTNGQTRAKAKNARQEKPEAYEKRQPEGKPESRQSANFPRRAHEKPQSEGKLERAGSGAGRQVAHEKPKQKGKLERSRKGKPQAHAYAKTQPEGKPERKQEQRDLQAGSAKIQPSQSRRKTGQQPQTGKQSQTGKPPHTGKRHENGSDASTTPTAAPKPKRRP